MHKGQQIKNKKPSTKQSHRIPHRLDKNTERHAHETASVNYLITIKQEKPRKCSDKIGAERQKVQKVKKIKFITDQIEKSTKDLLSVRSKSNRKERSAKLSAQNAEEENAYQLCRSSKRIHFAGEVQKSREKGSEKNNGKGNGNGNGNIKLRKEKSHSKDKLHLNLKLDGIGKATKKAKNGAKSSRKSQKNLQPRRFLSPQLVKLENSYYFSNYDEQEAKPPQPIPPVNSNTLPLPKKQTKFIFESNQDFWNDPQSKRLLTSTLDLLN